MAEQKGVAAPFPSPPPFYKHFTKQNIAQLRQIRKEAGVNPDPDDSNSSNNNETSKDVDISSLPPELHYLIPPEPPHDQKYTSFGAEIDLNAPEPTLESAGIEQLYPSEPSVRLNPQPHLVGLARSLLTTFLSLTGILSENPELYEEKVQDLQTIMYNMHHLINQYRPHQARETLILMMEERMEKMRAEIQAIDEAKGKVSRLLLDLKESRSMQTEKEEQDGVGSNITHDAVVAKRKARQRDAWADLDDQLTND